MFCPSCGKELDTNNVCINSDCPSNSQTTSEFESEFEKETINNNDSPIENVDENENPTNNDQNAGFNQSPNNNQNTGYNQNQSNNQNASYNQNNNNNQNAGYNQNNNNNQNAGYNQNNNNNQNAGYNQNSNNNQNAGYNQNSNNNQNAGYNQNSNNNQNNGYNQNANSNQNNGFNQNPNNNQNNYYNQGYNNNQGNSSIDKNGISAGEMMEFFGPKNTEYYMDKWNKSQENSSFISWNWPAFLFSFIWLCFRKMYSYAAIVLVVTTVSSIFLPGWASSIIGFAIMICSALFANQIYIKHSIDKIRTVKLTTGMNPSILFDRLRANGGITWVPVIILSVIFGLLFIMGVIAGFTESYNTIDPGYGTLY
ncbi:DUF2628 domain-containing protein [Clostridium vincentii]|uniref:Pesticidal crystal protein cry11Bb n=1 Tax=Clostridium vincentii TaxID=52704 RepID=A0A2T0BKM0_9CLOT|nr:DUF2628 domain-containing protein [Clostridium vincentii]PRR84407.1 Pesticidal crystal protein cry11Bb [Clostridium vincentii]